MDFLSDNIFVNGHQLCWWPLIAAAAAQLFGNLITNASNNNTQEEINQKNVDSQERINQANIESNERINAQQIQLAREQNDLDRSNQWAMFNAQNSHADSRQDYLNANGALIERRALEKAGINLNSGQFSANLTPVAGSQSLGNTSLPSLNSPQLSAAKVDPYFMDNPFASFGLGDILLRELTPSTQAEVQKTEADTRKENAEAKAQEIENERQETYDFNIAAYIKDRFKEAIENGDLVVDGNYKLYNKGTFDAFRDERRWSNEVKRLDVSDVRSVIDKLVANSQLQDSNTVSALTDLPYRKYQHLCESITNLVKEREVMDTVKTLNSAHADEASSKASLNRLEEEITRNSNIHEIITKYLGDGALSDAAHFITLIIGALCGNSHFAVNLSGKFGNK